MGRCSGMTRLGPFPPLPGETDTSVPQGRSRPLEDRVLVTVPRVLKPFLPSLGSPARPASESGCSEWFWDTDRRLPPQDICHWTAPQLSRELPPNMRDLAFQS